MTILNVYVSASRVIMAVDSRCVEVLPGGGYGAPLGPVPKLCCFERAGAVMACRGLARMGLYLRGTLGDGEDVQSLDSIDQALPRAFAQAQQKLLDELHAAGASYEGMHAVRLVGYSHKQGRMVCVAFDQVAPGAELVREVMEDGTEVGPWHDLQGEVPLGDSVGNMRQIALEQLDFQRQLDGDRSTVGGDVQIADLMRDAVRIHHFPDTGSRAAS